MCNEYLEPYFDQYITLSDRKKKKLDNKHDLVNLFLVDRYNYDNWFKNEKSTDTTRKIDKQECAMTPAKRLKTLISNKVLTRLPILLTQIKSEHNSYKLKNETK